MNRVHQLLLRAYPARWRARYGDEFEALLEERPLGPFDVADILLGALDAQLKLRGLGAASQHGRGFSMSLRIGGMAAVLGGILWFVVLAANAINNGSEAGVDWIGVVVLVATLATLVALVGLSAFQARRHPRLIWASFALPAASAVVSLFGLGAMATGVNSDRAIIGDPSPWLICMFGLSGLIAGSTLFALATWRTGSLSRPAAAMLGVGAILVLPAIAGVTGGVIPQEVAGLVLLVSIAAFPAGWAALGFSALRTGHPAVTSA